MRSTSNSRAARRQPNSSAIPANLESLLTGEVWEKIQTHHNLPVGETYYQILAEAIPQIVWSGLPDGTVDYCNQKWFDYTGKTSKQILLQDWFEPIHPHDRKQARRAWERAVKTKTLFEHEFRLLRAADQTYRWHLGRAVPIQNSAGQLIRWFGTTTDIDDQKHTAEVQAYLSQASRILSSTLDYETTLRNVAKLAIPQIADWCAIDMLDSRGNLQQLAVAHSDPKKIKWAAQYRREHPPDMSAAQGVAQVLRTGKPEIYPLITDEILAASARSSEELALLRKLGFKSVIIVPITNHKHIIGTISFISEKGGRSYSEQDLYMAQELGARASLAIENANLYTTAQAAIKTRDDFISIASHELKSPITSMKVYAQALQKIIDKSDKPELLRYAVKIDEQINKQIKLISDLLDVSKLQLGKMEYEMEKFKLIELVKDIIDSVQATTSQHRITLQGSVAKKIEADKERIGQVLVNLLTNAVKYSPQADRIMVKIKDRGSHVRVLVKDFGNGISPENQKRIFQRFYQVHSKTSRSGSGLGIGLYIAHQIVERHKGKLSVRSQLDKGSTFYFDLPYKQ